MNYMAHTPIYIIWIDFISYSSKILSDYLVSKGWRFENIICTQDEIKTSYRKNLTIISLSFLISNRKIYLSILENGNKLQNEKIGLFNAIPISAKKDIELQIRQSIIIIKNVFHHYE